MGRRAHTPEAAGRRQVEAMAAYGIPEADIATVIAIDPKTLRRHYRRELDTGHIKANTKVAENLYRRATGEGREAVTAAIFWLKTRARWKETTVHEVADATDSGGEHGDARRLSAIAMLIARSQMRDASLADTIQGHLAKTLPPPAGRRRS